MSQSNTVVDNADVPSGVFGGVKLKGNPPGLISLTNHSSTTGKITVLGSTDGVNWDNMRKLVARAGETVVRKVKITPYMQFHNARASFGPATLIVVNAD